MEMGELQGSKRSRVDANGWGYGDGDAKSGEGKGGGGGGMGVGVGVGIHANWHHNSSRICRVSRASGGKDRHSKVLTAKGLRDRRVRLSVSTAIQFYDLQDRLGVDQPSKAVEWLIKAASAAISELPALDGSFLDPPDQISDGNPRTRRDARGEVDASNDNKHEYEPQQQQQQQHLSRSKSACSSTSETSKGSVLSLSRSDIRVKARERAKERAAKDKEKKEGESAHHNQNQQQNHNSQSTFTELLTGGGSTQAQGSVTLAEAHPGSNSNGNGDAIFFHKQMRHLPTAITTDYFSQAGLFGQGQKHHQQPGFPGQSQYGNSSSGIMSFNTVVASSAGDHPEMQQPYSFLQDHLIPVTAVAPGGEYSLNFSISSGLAGFNRGTLQSNPPSSISHHHHLQRLSSSVDSISLPFGISAPTAATPTSGENPFPSGYDSRLQLYYTDGYRSADLKGKGKN